ncbi:MAG: hypothetical protein K1060chlam2_01144, partial [Chlamydiae bacterium]|nr:hypothetical protein [Chlamydiota bacterium]
MSVRVDQQLLSKFFNPDLSIDQIEEMLVGKRPEELCAIALRVLRNVPKTSSSYNVYCFCRKQLEGELLKKLEICVAMRIGLIKDEPESVKGAFQAKLKKFLGELPELSDLTSLKESRKYAHAHFGAERRIPKSELSKKLSYLVQVHRKAPNYATIHKIMVELRKEQVKYFTRNGFLFREIGYPGPNQDGSKEKVMIHIPFGALSTRHSGKNYINGSYLDSIYFHNNAASNRTEAIIRAVENFTSPRIYTLEIPERYLDNGRVICKVPEAIYKIVSFKD